MVDPTTEIPEPTQRPVYGYVDDHEAADSSAIAVRQDDKVWTRGQLRAASESIARALATRLPAGERVALHGSSSFGLVAGLLGVLRARMCVVPLSTRLPDDVRRRLLAGAGVPLVLSVGGTGGDDGGVTSLAIGADTGTISGGPVEPSSASLPDPDMNAAAYIMFTSGTTGAQKGVVGCHKGLSHFISWQSRTFGDLAGPTCAQLIDLGFDVVLRDILFPLATGKTLVLPPFELTQVSVQTFLDWLERERITALHTVPSLARTWLSESASGAKLPALKCMFVAGEPLPGDLVKGWRQRFAASTEFINLYGPTETTLAKCFHRIGSDPESGVQPIGRPLPDTQVLILGKDNQLCAVGEAGEIVIRTPFRSLGYLDRSSAENQRFIPNPFRNDPSDVVYKTGDVGAYRADGTLEIHGRVDDQIKIRGQRVDPQGVATFLRTHASVADAVVIAVKTTGEPRLVAYVVPRGSALETTAIQEFARAQLPPYMLPEAIVSIAAVPLTANGKLDRKALPPVSTEVPARENVVEPRTATEQALVEIWAGVLGVTKVGLDDDFFQLGGHSLTAIKLVSRVRARFEIEVPVRALFGAPTVARFAAWIDNARAKAKPTEDPATRELATWVASLSPADLAARLETWSSVELSPSGDGEKVGLTGDRRRLFELLHAQHVIDTQPTRALARQSSLVTPAVFAQEMFWDLHRAGTLWHLAVKSHVFVFGGDLVVEAMQRAVDDLVARQDALRSVFERTGDKLTQIVRPHGPALEVIDLRGVEAAQRDAQLAQVLEGLCQPPDPTQRVFRAGLVRIADDESRLVLTWHRIAVDGSSRGILLRDLTALYRAHVRKEPSPLAPLAMRYGDFAFWQRSLAERPLGRQQLAFWQRSFEGYDGLLVAGSQQTRPRRTSGLAPETAPAVEVSLEIEGARWETVQAVATRLSCTPYTIVLSGFLLLLARWSGQWRVCINCAQGHRIRPGMDDVVGVFVTPYPFRANFDEQDRLEDAVRRVHDAVLAVRENAHVEPLTAIPSYAEWMRYMFNFQMVGGAGGGVAADAEDAWREVPAPKLFEGRTPHDMYTFLMNHPEGVSGRLGCSTSRFTQQHIERAAEWIGAFIDRLGAAPGSKLRDLPAVERTG